MKSQSIAPGIRILLSPEIEQKTGLSDTTRWRLERRGEFPARVQLSPGRIGWIESQIDEWLLARQVRSTRRRAR